MAVNPYTTGNPKYDLVAIHFIKVLIEENIQTICRNWILHKADIQKDLSQNLYDLFMTLIFQKFDLQIHNGCYICLFSTDKVNLRINTNLLTESIKLDLRLIEHNAENMFNRILTRTLETEFILSQFKYSHFMEQYISRRKLIAFIIESIMAYARGELVTESELLKNNSLQTLQRVTSLTLQNLVTDVYTLMQNHNPELERETNIYNDIGRSCLSELAVLVQELRRNLV